ncbi:MAG: hypothetical protein GXP62_06135, partial [Oligoflexia bacterium]|nr:hypothetical protein [Oligoflexia bacterium]
NTIDDTKALRILQTAIPFREDPDDPHPSRFFAVQQGVIYEAAPTRPGLSCHGYPWRGHQPRVIKKKLEAAAELAGCHREFKRWLGRYAA